MVGAAEGAMPGKAGLSEGPEERRGGKGAPVVDEPVFVLRARDMLAPRVVVRWASLAEQANVSRDKVASALRRAKEMADWQARNPDCVRLPD